MLQLPVQVQPYLDLCLLCTVSFSVYFMYAAQRSCNRGCTTRHVELPTDETFHISIRFTVLHKGFGREFEPSAFYAAKEQHAALPIGDSAAPDAVWCLETRAGRAETRPHS